MPVYFETTAGEILMGTIVKACYYKVQLKNMRTWKHAAVTVVVVYTGHFLGHATCV